ncbi:C40 family peptidase [Neisseriaceae bacterium TC5R-5]|nr:C40 family peptidase [Neisseriaceae bacterium TC5R-5]
MKLPLRLIATVLAGFILFAQAAPETTFQDDPPSTQVTTSDDAKQDRAASAEDAVGGLLLQAMSLLGVAYRFGGNSPETGLDCSGFIRYVFQRSLKVNLPRTVIEMAKLGRAVNKSELVPGDLVFFNTRGFNYSHAGIYMGNGKFIHAPRTGKNIEVVNMNQSYWTARYNGARRVNRTTALLSADTSDDVSVASPKRTAALAPTCRKGHKKCKSSSTAASTKKAGTHHKASTAKKKKAHR